MVSGVGVIENFNQISTLRSKLSVGICNLIEIGYQWK